MAIILRVSIGLATESGLKPDNEDFADAKITEEPQLTHKGIVVAIADGMSGCEAPRLASQCCVKSFLADYYSTPDSWSVKLSGQKVLSATNSWLYSQGLSRYRSSSSIVSTLSILVLKSTTAHIFHIGDSRIYRYRKGNLEQMTRDHRIWMSGHKHFLSRAMGIEPRFEVDYKSLPMELGDVFLTSTDGIHEFLDDKSLKEMLAENEDPSVTAEKILQRALANGSDDNLTCQVVRIDNLPEPKEDEILRRHANLPFPPLLQPGMVIDGYRIESELHASRRTQIYRALDGQSDQQVVLKTPSTLFDDDTHFIEHFLHEEWAGKRINHANVIKILPVERTKSYIYYVTEYLTGPTLRDWMTLNPKADILTVRKIVEQIAKGLRALHRKGMLHQDLKPENIMFDKTGSVKIIDFGSVKIAGIAEISPWTLGRNGHLLGTLNYSAPEYHLGENGTVKSDIFSLGVIAYEMLNGKLPFDKEIPEKADRNFFAKLTYIPSFHRNPMIPNWLDGALKKATSITPQFRYDELSEFLYDLNYPNPNFLRTEDKIPLLQQNPLRFWQGFSVALLIINLILLSVMAINSKG